MSDENHAIRDDIAFMRSLAEQGREGPLLGGSIMVAAGALFGTSSLLVAWGVSGRGPAAWAGWLQWVWPVSAVLFFAYLAAAKLRQRGEVRGPAARGAGVAWSAIGWAMGAIIVSLIIMSNRAHDWRIVAAFGPIVLSLYGGGWFAAACLTRRRWLWAVAWASFAMAPIMAWVAVDQVALFTIYGVSLFLLAALPGFVLMRQAAREG